VPSCMQKMGKKFRSNTTAAANSLQLYAYPEAEANPSRPERQRTSM
jgi:hypothetical protein